MAASFLQYCAMCERQITTPSNSILYCSQACRRKDAAKPISASILPPSPTHNTSGSGANSRVASPSRISAPSTSHSTPASPTPTIRIPTDQHAHKQDLDPTEWKPKLRRPDGLVRGGGLMRKSEAYRYLASFHTRSMQAEAGHLGLDDHGKGGMHRYSSSMYTLPTTNMMTPSLSNTPTTTASSFDGSWEKHPVSVDGGYAYDFSTRPLQSRCNPLYTVGSGAKVEDLVTPFVPPKVVVGAIEAVDDGMEDFWGKKAVVKGGAGKSLGLGKLISEGTM